LYYSADAKIAPEDVRLTADDSINAAADVAQNAKAKFIRSQAARMRVLDSQIGGMTEANCKLHDETKSGRDCKLLDLEKKRTAACLKLLEISHASNDAWKHLQTDAQVEFHDLDKAVRETLPEP
jgi:hypothetical protein